MKEAGLPSLGAFALLIQRPTWICGKPDETQRKSVAWRGVGLGRVSLVALRDGTVIFQFDKAPQYSGGAVPPCVLGEDRRVPADVITADEARINLAYRRFEYMNALLLALYSGISTIQKRGTQVQEPMHPTNYFGAREEAQGWSVFMDDGRKIEYPRERSDNVESDTLDHALEIMRKFEEAIGENAVGLMSLVYTACHQYSLHQFSSAHVMAWTSIEATLKAMWKRLQSEIDLDRGGHTTLNNRRRKLLAGRDYTASVVAQILSINRKIDDKTLERLTDARRRRNDFVHSLAPVDLTDAGKAIRLATDMMGNLAGIRITSQLSTEFWL